MDPVGVISLIYDVSKDLYAWYQTVKDCDTDIKELRTQLLQLHNLSDAIRKALGRKGLRAEEKSHVEEAVSKCADAATELKSHLDKIRLDEVQPQKALARLKALGRKAVYPFKKSTIAGLSEEVETCQDALHVAVSILQLNVGATAIEQLGELDDKLVALEISYDEGKSEIVRHLLQCRKMLEDEGEWKKALAIVESLKYPEMSNRRHDIPDGGDSSLRWIFNQKSHEYPEVSDLLEFLNEESGLFWVQGKPASGKSVLMKYLLNCAQGRDKLWEWSGTRNVIFASHFCWIAGTPMQRSQQGLLRSLLYSILQADLGLVPIACPFQWTAGAGQDSWHEKELWACLYAAVEASDKRICFFIDGLDEVKPEKDLFSLAKAIVKLSSYESIKVVASSRPWDAFERTLKQDKRTLAVESINRLSIIGHVRDQLDANAIDQTFSRVSWDCIKFDDWWLCKQKHQHDDAHNLIETIADRSEGVFLWVALVMEAVCRHIALGCPIVVLRSYLDRFPIELEDYFRTMIFKRIHESVFSETAMALKIASFDNNTLSSFALLCDYRDMGRSPLMDADFVSKVPMKSLTYDQLAERLRMTTTFLRECCRDMIKVSPNPQDTGNDAYIIPMWRSPRWVTFTHRTIFDFLCTPDMQLLIERHVPDHFNENFFEAKLGIASCKAALLDEHSVEELQLVTYQLYDSTRKLPADSGLAVIAEDVAINRFKIAENFLKKPEKVFRRVGADDYFGNLAIMFATRGLFRFMDSLSQVAPVFLSSYDSGTDVIVYGVMLHEANVGDVEVLRKLLQAGLDPNYPLSLEVWPRAHADMSPWHLLLDRLRVSADTSSEPNNDSTQFWIEELLEESGIPRESAIEGNWPEKPGVEDLTKLLIEFGADIAPEDVDFLTKCFPPKDGDGFDWPGFLHTYSQPEKRLQLEEDRRNRIRDWPEKFLSRRDMRLLGLIAESPESSEDESSTEQASPSADLQGRT